MKKHTLFGLLLFSTFMVVGQNFNRPVPAEFPQYEFVKHDTSFNYLYCSTPITLNNYNATLRNLSVFDEMGYLLWYAQTNIGNYTDLKFHSQHQLYSFVHQKNQQEGVFYLMDTLFQMVDSILLANNVWIDSHEFQLLDNGNMILSGRKDTVVDMSSDTINGAPGSDSTTLIGFVIQEFDASHNLLFEWNSNDYVNPLEAYSAHYGYNPNRFDYCHGNAIEKDQEGNYLVSFRHTNSVYKVDGSNGQVIWKLGGKDSDFTFQNDSGFSGQHDIRVHSNGRISLFDNSNTSSSNESRAVEFVLDTINWTATKVWEYKYSPPFFSRAMGSYQRKANFRLVNYGLNYRPNPSFVVIDSSGQTISEFYYRDSTVAYRSYGFKPDNPIVRTKVNCDNQNGVITLTATGGSSFIWNTGATSASITVSNPGVYQVWSNKGIGMLGSEPMFIDSINNFCVANSIEELALEKDRDKIIEGIYDLSGRRVNLPRDRRIYIIRYQNGQAEKVFWNFEK